MAGQSLYEQIAEEAKLVDEFDNINSGDDDGEDDGGSNAGRNGSVRGQSGQLEGEPAGEGAIPELGGPGERGIGEKPSRGEGGASSEDARAPHGDARAPQGSGGIAQEEGGGAQEDARPSSEDGESLLEKPPTNAEWARQRREARELKAEIARLKAASPAAPAVPAAPIAEAKSTETKPVDAASKEPDKNVNYQEWLEWKLAQNDTTIGEQNKLIKEFTEWRSEEKKNRDLQQLTTAAVGEFQKIEDSYRGKNADYDNAIGFSRQKYFDAAKLMYPNQSDAAIEVAIDRQMLKFAADCAQKGLNPAEELYGLAMERFGYTKAEPKEDAPPKLPQRPAERPNLKTISNNRRKSASPLSGGGQGGRISITPEAAADMSIGEFSRLTPDDLAALEAMA